MKVSKLVLCILLSLALVVTFIPVMSFAQDDGANAQDEEVHAQSAVNALAYGDAREIVFDGASPFNPGGDCYTANLDHGKLSVGTSCFKEGRPFGVEGEDFSFSVYPDALWDVESVQYSVDGGKTWENVTETLAGSWNVPIPADGGNDPVQVKIALCECTKEITSVTVTLKAPVCGTKTTSILWQGSDRGKPQPELVFPDGAEYEADSYPGQNYGVWYNSSGDYEFTMKGGETYTASIKIRPKKGDYFADNCSVKVSGGKPSFVDCYYNKELVMDVDTKAVHNWKWESTAAGLLKNGCKQQRCTECNATQKKKVIPGWAISYVKGLTVAKGKQSFTVKWKKQSKANQKKFNGYQIRYSLKSNMKGARTTTAKKSSKSKTIKKLKAKTKYYVQVRTYTKKSGKTFYSNWSGKKTVKTK